MLPVIAFIILFLIIWEILIVAEPIVRGGLRRIAHLTAKLRYRDYLPVIVLLAIGAGVTAAAGDGFIDIAELVVEKSPALQTIDQQWHDTVVYARDPGSTTFFALMSVIGGPAVMTVVAVIVAGVLIARRRYRWAIYLVVTAGGGALLNIELKRYFERARPGLAEMLRRAHGYSFPSGHAMGSTVVIGALTYVVVRLLRTWRQKAAAIAFAVPFVLSVAASRIYLGVHWISDIGAGLTAGLLWLITTTVGYETFRRIRLIRALRAKSFSQREKVPRSGE